MQEKDIKTINLRNINGHLSALLRGQDLDFCKLLIHDHQEDLSITAKYDPPQDFVSLGDEAPSDADAFYYGVSPCLDRQELMRCISSLEVQDAQALEAYVHKHGDWFMIHSAQKVYLPALAKYIVICMASHFGIRIQMEEQVYRAFLNFLQDCGYSAASIKTMLSYSQKADSAQSRESKPKESVLTIRGCPTAEVLRFLEQYEYRRASGESGILRIDGKGGNQKGALAAWEIVDRKDAPSDAKSIREVYAEHTELIEGRVFYSGVLLRPTQFELVRGTQENYKIQSLCLHFERSTYGTVCALDRNLTEHPALQDAKAQIIEMLRADDRAKKTLNEALEQIDAEDAQTSSRIIDAVNAYLGECFNVNQITVSANIVTSDGLLLIGQRSQANIDAKKLYPGVNGNAEVADRKVPFYSLSVYEDYPTIRLDSDRIDFFGEIGRETYGELQINLPKQEWKCCSMILIGKIPKECAETPQYQETSRRMHCNLIFEQHTERSFLEIEKLSASAAEAFETERYLGVSVRCEQDSATHLLKTVGRGILGIVSQKDFIEASVALILFLLAISRTLSEGSLRMETLHQSLKALGGTDILTLFLAVLIISITGLRSLRALRQYLHRRKCTRFITIYRKDTYEDVNRKVERALRLPGDKNALYPFHPPAAACLRYYVDNVICESFFPKDKR